MASNAADETRDVPAVQSHDLLATMQQQLVLQEQQIHQQFELQREYFCQQLDLQKEQIAIQRKQLKFLEDHMKPVGTEQGSTVFNIAQDIQAPLQPGSLSSDDTTIMLETLVADTDTSTKHTIEVGAHQVSQAPAASEAWLSESAPEQRYPKAQAQDDLQGPLVPHELSSPLHDGQLQDISAGKDENKTFSFTPLEEAQSMLDVWKSSDGLHTVDSWVSNYREHPAGWAALLCIHGIPEVTGRLRSKVENYAIYSALFLSMSIDVSITGPPTSLRCRSDETMCLIRARIFMYSIGIGAALHMLSIMLGMSFVNALNETARDSDVFRMFARGRAFFATVKCQTAFRVGASLNFIAMVTAFQGHIGWEALILSVLMASFVLWTYKTTTDLLFKSCSICGYWREECGGRPDADDPYDLHYPMEVFKQRVLANQHFFMEDKSKKKQGSSTQSLVSSLTPKFSKIIPTLKEKKAAAKVANAGIVF